MKMKNWVLALLFLSIGQISVVMAPTQAAILVTSKPQYAIGEVVYFTLINTSTVPIGETYGDPWTIYKDVDGKWEHVYAPPYRRVDWTMNHGECRTWKGDSFFEKDMHSTVTVDAGTYKVVMDITHAGTSSATFTLEEPASFSAFYSLLYYFLFSVALGFVLIYISARVIKIEDVTVQKTLGVTLISAVCSTAFLIVHPWGNLVGFALVLPAVKVIYKTTWEKALAVFVVYGAVQLALVLISMGVITLF
jgi:hypothetical protein